MSNEPSDHEQLYADYRAQFARVGATCIRLYLQTRDSQPWSSELTVAVEKLAATLGEIWGALAIIYARRAPAWRVDSDAPGYLIRSIDEADLRLPYHLAADFPKSDDFVTALARLALSLRCTNQSAVCISGSTTFWDALEFVADVDFCEYVPRREDADDAALAADFEKARALRAAGLVCLRGSARGKDGSELDVPADLTRGFVRAKLDFLALLAGDVIEATNVVLAVNPSDPNDPSFARSFAQQEAPIGDWVPRSLLDPLSIGQYAHWLREEVASKLGKDPIKAAKRALSLARIAGYDARANELIEGLGQCPELVETALKARRELEEEVNALSTEPDLHEPFLHAFAVTIGRLEAALEERRERLDAAQNLRQNDLMQGMVATIDRLLGDIAAGIAPVVNR